MKRLARLAVISCLSAVTVIFMIAAVGAVTQGNSHSNPDEDGVDRPYAADGQIRGVAGASLP